MAEAYLGEIRLFSLSYAPKGWEKCEGQMLSVKANIGLFSLLNTMYGGDGINTFALPDLRGRVPICCNATYIQGKADGHETHTLLRSEMPLHTHEVRASTKVVDTGSPTNAAWGKVPAGYAASANTLLHAAAIGQAGGSQPHNNMQPYMALTFCICTQGYYPPRQ